MTTETFRSPTPVSRPPFSSAADARASQASENGTRPVSWGVRARWPFFAVLLVLASLVFWAFDALPFQDLPAHAGIIALRHRIAGSTFDQRFFVFAPHLGPYSLFRFLGEAFYPLVGPIGAVRALETLPVLALPAALVWGRRRLHADTTPAAGFLALALSFGLMTAMGFASYLLGVAVMLFALVAWLELLVAADEEPASPTARRRELIVAVMAPLVFVAHGHAFVLFLLLAAVSCVSCVGIGTTTERDAKKSARSVEVARLWTRILRLRALIPAVLLAAWVAWTERASTVPAGSIALPNGGLAPRFQGPVDKLSLLLTPTLLTKSGIDLTLGVGVWFLLGTLAFYTLRSVSKKRLLADRSGMSDASGVSEALDPSIRHARALFACAATLLVLFLALPHAIGWFGFVDGRLVPLVMVLAILAFRRHALPAALERFTDNAAPIVAFGIVATALVASARFQGEAAGYREVLGAVPEGAHLLNLPVNGDSDVFAGHPFIHYDKLVMAERSIVPSDIWFHQGTAVYPTPENPALHLPPTYSESDLHGIDWPAYTLSDWDYVLVRTRPDAQAPEVPRTLTLAVHRGGWWLFHHAI